MLRPLPIPRISPVPKKKFYKKYVETNTPVVISGLIEDWPARVKWDIPFFADNYSQVKAGVVPLKAGMLDLNTERGSRVEFLPIQESLTSVMNGPASDGWAVASATELFPDSLSEDYRVPDYCADGRFLRSRIFLGATGTVTSLHQDLFENLYITIKGCKRITIFAPDAAVYRYSPFSKIPNHAQVDPEKPDDPAFPKFQNAQPYIVDLYPGETLYIPSFWWHHLRNMEPSVTMSFWWSSGWKLTLAWAAAAYKKMRSI